MKTQHQRGDSPVVGLFVTCLVNSLRPSVGMASAELLERHNCTVVVPSAQTCCGQPGYNSGDDDSALQLAEQTINAFADVDYVVVPSGSCAGMMVLHYPGLFAPDSVQREQAGKLAAKTFELTQFLVDVLQVTGDYADFPYRLTYHDSCAGLRELGVKKQPRQLLANASGSELCEMQDTDVCCGFGGTFCVKYPQISTSMVDDKINNIAASESDVVVGGDLGCLLNIAGRMKRLGRHEKVFHVAEILAGKTDQPAIAQVDGLASNTNACSQTLESEQR